ncbi:MAG: segregation and condensation protein A [bacterium]
MSYQIQLENFQGPFDLLFHLLDRDEIDIYDIPIARITCQYLEYLASWEELDINSASEFLLMAARLVEIKSKMLLPCPQVKDEADTEIDPREELVMQLLEYRRYRNIVTELQELIDQQSTIFTRPKGHNQASDSRPLEGLSVMMLARALGKVLQANPAFKALDVEIKEINITKKVEEILAILRGKKEAVSFNQLINSTMARIELIGNFLALLELIHLDKVRVFQRRLFGEIFIILRKE